MSDYLMGAVLALAIYLPVAWILSFFGPPLIVMLCVGFLCGVIAAELVSR